MKTSITISSLLIFTIFFTSCASSYKSIEPATIYYSSKNEESNILLEYQYDLLKKNIEKKNLKITLNLWL
jgi:hypothetical protein